MPNRPKSHEIDPDAPEDLATWAGELVAAIGKRQARKALEDYQRLAADRRLTKFDRAIARKQAKALAELL